MSYASEWLVFQCFIHFCDYSTSRVNTNLNTLEKTAVNVQCTGMRSSHKVTAAERFPIKPRRDGRFQKRIHGTLYYFGGGGNRKAALAEYERVKHDLYAGRKPRAMADPDTLTLKTMANLFIDEQEARNAAGDISAGHLADYRWAIRRFLKKMSGGRLVSDLGPDDFAIYRRFLLSKVGGYAYNRERACIVAMFNHAEQCGWLINPVRFGKGFAKVGVSELRVGRKNRKLESGTIKTLIGKAASDLKAKILLGINGGMGATDCATLQLVDLDLVNRRINTIRRKRMTVRHVPLWPETVEALAPIVAKRSADDHLVFGAGNAEVTEVTNLIKEFTALCDELKIKRPAGVAFNALRHTFSTLANALQDKDATRRIMGHKFSGMDDTYVEDIDWQRLKRVTDHVRQAIFSSRGSGRGRTARKQRAGQPS